MPSLKLPILGLWITSVLLAACSTNLDNVNLSNDEIDLVDRMTLKDEAIVVENTLASSKIRAYAKPVEQLSLKLVAEIAAPVYEGVTLHATEVTIKGNKAYVSYNVKGETFLGGVDIIDISNSAEPKLISNMIFTDRDINGLSVDGNKLYLASASDSIYSTPAILDIITLEGGKLTDSIETVDLPSFAATDVEVAGNSIYVTSGADGGYVSILNKNTLGIQNQIAVEDARGVDSDGQDVAVVAGTPARLIVLDNKTGELNSDYSLVGASIDHSKSTVEIKQGKAFLGLGDGGMQVVCLADGTQISRIDQPIMDGMDASVSVTNAVSAYKRSVFISNGEAGVYVAMAESNLDKNGCAIDNLAMMGKLKMDDLVSVNHVVYRSDVLFIAAGSGGLKIVEVSDAGAEADLDDSE